MKQLQLTKGKIALIDDEDFEKASKYKWQYLKIGYAARTEGIGEKRKMIYLHRFIMDFPEGMEVDHIDRDKLDNRRSNLRCATRSTNSANHIKRVHHKNTSRYKGVGWFVRDSKWRANITVNYKNINLGYYESETDAALAYDRAAEKHFGSFAVLNFPNDKTVPVKSKSILRKNNSIGFRGVQKTGIRYSAKVRGVGYHSGFSTPIEAALAYNYLAFHKNGSSAILNQLEIT